MNNDMVHCRACGGVLHISAPLCPHCGAPQDRRAFGDGIKRTLGSSIEICFRKYVTFSGRAPRAEFWWFTLFQTLVQWAAAAAAFGSDAPGASAVETLVSLVLICPAISVAVRRLHDLDRSGWWFWIVLIPIVGWIILLVWDCTRGTPGPNRFGPENGLL